MNQLRPKWIESSKTSSPFSTLPLLLDLSRYLFLRMGTFQLLHSITKRPISLNAVILAFSCVASPMMETYLQSGASANSFSVVFVLLQPVLLRCYYHGTFTFRVA